MSKLVSSRLSGVRRRFRTPRLQATHAGLTAGRTLNVAVTPPGSWTDPTIVLRSGRREIAVPTRVISDLRGDRRAEVAVLLAGDSTAESSLPVVIVPGGVWAVLLRDTRTRRSIVLSHPVDRAPDRSLEGVWSMSGSASGDVTITTGSVVTYPRVDTATIGFTSFHLAGELVGRWGAGAELVLRRRDGGQELRVPVELEEARFRVGVPLDDMAGSGGTTWECLMTAGDQRESVRCAAAATRDHRFDIDTPVRLVETPGGRQLKVRAYCNDRGEINISVVTIREESK